MPSIWQFVIFAMETTQMKNAKLGTLSLKQNMLILCQTTTGITTLIVQHICLFWIPRGIIMDDLTKGPSKAMIYFNFCFFYSIMHIIYELFFRIIIFHILSLILI
jgi:hypothetical protein